MKKFDYLEFIFDEDIICWEKNDDMHFSKELPIECFPESFKKMYYEDKEYALKIGAATERSRNLEDIKMFKALLNEVGV